jgi:hypothetical protein
MNVLTGALHTLICNNAKLVTMFAHPQLNGYIHIYIHAHTCTQMHTHTQRNAHYLAIKNSELLINTIAWLNFRKIMEAKEQGD